MPIKRTRRRILLIFLCICLVNYCVAYCPPGCTCSDQLLNVVCDHANLSSIPILLNPLLRRLSLVNTRIQKLDSYSIGVYQELEFLDLSNNDLVELPNGFLNELSQLKELRLRNNRLKLVDAQIFRKLNSLEKLDLSHNELERIMPKSFSDLFSLKYMNLSSNQLHMLDSNVFEGLSSIQTLDLSNNRLSQFNQHLFQPLTTLKEFNLNRNHFFKIPNSVFNPLKHLRNLDLSLNILSEIEDQAFSNLQTLEKLDLSKNLLTIIPNKNWPYLAGLQRLDLSSNRFASIPTSAFDGLRSLQELNISNVKELVSVQANAFVGLESLNSLYISNCPSLKYFDGYAFEHPNMLRNVDLSNNALTTLDYRLLNWEQLGSLELAGNQWHCDCQLSRFMPETLQCVKPIITPYCATPEQMFNVPVENATPLYCSSLSESAWPIIAVGGALGLITILLLLLICIRSKLSCCRSKHSNNSRLPFYATGSSYTDSLTYDKTHFDPLLAAAAAAQARTYLPKPSTISTDDSNEYYSSILFQPVTNENQVPTMYRHIPPGNLSPNNGVYNYGRPPPPCHPAPPPPNYRVICNHPPMTEL